MTKTYQKKWMMPVLFWVAWLAGVENETVSQQVWNSRISGDTRFSSDAEARSMSPPHWGSESPQDWPANAPRDLDVGNDPVWNPPLGKGNSGRLDQAQRSSSDPSFLPASSSRDADKRYPLNPQSQTDSQEPRDEHSSRTWTPQPSLPFSAYPDYSPDPRWGFRPEIAHRQSSWDSGEPLGFEGDGQQYPSLGEILSTGKWFGSAEYQLLSAKFNNHVAFNVVGPSEQVGRPFDFGYRSAPRFRFGFESKLGPGFELDYFQFDHQSKLTSFTTGVSEVGEASTWMVGSSEWSRMQSTGPVQTFLGRHDLEVHSLCLSFFKDYKLPRARVNGMLGARYVSVAQHGDVRLLDAGWNDIERLQHITDVRGVGPRAVVEYARRIGHTRLEMVGGIGSSLLFGNRDQFVQNTQTGIDSRTSTNHLWTVWELNGGVQYVVPRGEDRFIHARLGVTHQIWLGGGSANNPLDDFGFRGLVATVGFNR